MTDLKYIFKHALPSVDEGALVLMVVADPVRGETFEIRTFSNTNPEVALDLLASVIRQIKKELTT